MAGKSLGPLENSAQYRETRRPRHQLREPPYHPVTDRKVQHKNNRHNNNLFHALQESTLFCWFSEISFSILYINLCVIHLICWGVKLQNLDTYTIKFIFFNIDKKYSKLDVQGLSEIDELQVLEKNIYIKFHIGNKFLNNSYFKTDNLFEFKLFFKIKFGF